MNFFSAAFLFGFVALATCANNYEQYGQRAPKPQRRPMKQNNYQQAQGKGKTFNAEEVQNIIQNAVPGKDFPTFSMDYMPKTSFKCDAPNIHYPGYYADVETGCQVFHYCPPKLEDNYQPPQGGYKQQPMQEEQQYRKKRASYGQQETPATYYDTEETPYAPQPQYPPSAPVMKPYHKKPKYDQPEQRIEEYQPPQQQYEQEEQLISWLCPNQTIFNQQTLVCEWFFNVVCEHAIQNYDLANSRLYQENAPLLDEVPEVEHPSNLNTAPAAHPAQYEQTYEQPKHKMPRRPAPQQPRYNEPKY